jgi:hypothetical protein
MGKILAVLFFAFSTLSAVERGGGERMNPQINLQVNPGVNRNLNRYAAYGAYGAYGGYGAGYYGAAWAGGYPVDPYYYPYPYTNPNPNPSQVEGEEIYQRDMD